MNVASPNSISDQMLTLKRVKNQYSFLLALPLNVPYSSKTAKYQKYHFIASEKGEISAIPQKQCQRQTTVIKNFSTSRYQIPKFHMLCIDYALESFPVNIRVVPVVESPLDFLQVTAQVLLADLVERPHNGTLK